jgi:bis(5'-nucleosyl)-tetraphosphatase (symmetrical)
MIWAIGDIQGCYRSFMALLEKIDFDPKRDRLWLVGDLINRGSGSLETMRYCYEYRDSIEVVLGNHDLSLIGAFYGLKKSNPTIDPILNAPDAPQLIGWLRKQKFLHIDEELGYCIAHAGIPPEFDLSTAVHYAQILEQNLQGDGSKEWLKRMFDCDGHTFAVDAECYALAGFVRMRFCHEDGKLEFKQKCHPTMLDAKHQGLKPWFELPNRKKLPLKIIFGHWATLGYYSDGAVVCLDTGCVWGKTLMALRLDTPDKQIVQAVCG